LLDYPAPAIFLFQRINEFGDTSYDLVDGKQRLTAVFDFINNEFPVAEKAPIESFRGKFFQSLPSDTKVAFFEYDFPVEYLPVNNEDIINTIFDRLNRNTMKLSPQELRHAKYNGAFINRAEHLAEWMEKRFERPFPRFTGKSKRQMKEVEIVASLLLFLEEGPKGYSAEALDMAFAERDEEWERGDEIVDEFRTVINHLTNLVRDPDGQIILKSRFQNQADFYSLFGAIAELSRDDALPSDYPVMAERLKRFIEYFERTPGQPAPEDAIKYFDAARSASNDAGSRKERIRVMKRVLKGEELSMNIS
jgi:hypothetical protein